MRNRFLPQSISNYTDTSLRIGLLLLFIILINVAFGAAKSSAASGNWSDANTWLPVGVPDSGDHITIKGGHTVTIDGNYTCTNLQIGNATNAGATLQITASGKSLTVNGTFSLNPNNRAYVYTLNAGPGQINIAGSSATWSTTGTNRYLVSTGSLTFAPAVSITSSTAHQITLSGAGTITFNGAFSDKYNKLTTYAGCTVNFGSSYTAVTTTANWNGNGTAVFTGTSSSVTPTSSITFNDVQIAAGKTLTLNTGSGTVAIGGSLTMGSGSTFNSSKDFTISGNWTNNGGTYSGASNTITFNGVSKTIGGTSATAFGSIIIGKSGGGALATSYTVESDASCVNLTFDGNTLGRTLALTTGKTFSISGNLTINQPSTAGYTNLLDIGGAICTVAGNLNFSGSSATVDRVAKINVTSGSFELTGSVSWMGNVGVTTEVISVGTGTLTFSSPLQMLTGSGTLQSTGAATINFNGIGAKSFMFGGIIAPVFSTASGTTVNFLKGFQNLITAPTFASGTEVTVGSSSDPADIDIDPSSSVTNYGHTVVHGNLTSSSNSTFVNGANATLEIKGNISSNVQLDASAAGNTVKYNGRSAQTIKAGTYVNLVADNTSTLSTETGTTIVTGNLNLNRGYITTTASKILKLSSTATCSAPSWSSFVRGPMIKAGNSDFTFPVGKAGRLAPVGISGIANAATEVSVEFFDEPYADVTTLGQGLTQVGQSQYWMIDRTGTTDPVKIKLYWENASDNDIINCDYLTIAHYTGGQWQEEPAAVTPGSECTYGGGTGSIEMLGTVSTFSPFGFGGNGGGALPIKLVSFDAVVKGNVVKTSWVTELEIDNAFFTIERSSDAVNFEEVAKVEGAGNSTQTLSYESFDNSPLPGTAYYRLKQTDFDGQFSYSDIKMVTIGEKSEFTFFPNPTDNELNLNVSNPSNEVKVVIYDMAGREMFAQIYPVDSQRSKSVISIQAKYLLPTGIYMVNASSSGVEHRERVVLK